MWYFGEGLGSNLGLYETHPLSTFRKRGIVDELSKLPLPCSGPLAPGASSCQEFRERRVICGLRRITRFLSRPSTALMPWFPRPSLYAVHLAFLGLYAATIGSVLGLILVGSLTFGYGLGDLFFLGTHVVLCLLLLALGWAGRATGKPLLTGLLAGAMLGQLAFLSLQLTLWRGSEYQWNQQVFLYPPWASRQSAPAGGVLRSDAKSLLGSVTLVERSCTSITEQLSFYERSFVKCQMGGNVLQSVLRRCYPLIDSIKMILYRL